MNPAWIDNMSWEMAEVYGAVNDQILINLAHRFQYFDASNLPRSSFAYQAKMLAQMGQVRKETIQIIRNNLDDADDALTRILEEAIIDSVKSTEPELLEGVKRGLLNVPQTPVLSANQMQAFKYYYKQSADKLNLVNTVMLESTQQAYQAAVSDVVSEIGLAEAMNRVQIGLDSATGEVVTGVSSWNEALRHATDKMKDAGIVGFIDHGGHRWSAEAYAAMDIRTTVANTARAAVWETNQNFGNDLYLVSYHDGARPLCYPWQNKVISSLDRSGVTYDLDGNEIPIYPQSSTSYGQPAGLFGINCKHYPTPWIPGVSVADGEPQDKEENDRVYAESQEQRRLERKLREEKRDLMMAKAQGASEEEINALREKCRNSSQDIDDFCKSTGRQRRRNREGVYTKRDFPEADKYDTATFAKEQKQLMEEYRKYGGAQTGNTFGVMTPKVPIIPATPVTPVQPVQPVQPVATTQPVANVAQNAPQPTSQGGTIEGHTDKLKRSMTPDEYDEFVKMTDRSETAKLYETYGDSCAEIRRVPHGGKYKSSDIVEYDFENKIGRSKYSTLSHEMGHMFDAKIGESATLTFNEVHLINNKCAPWQGSTFKVIKAVPSASDQFLAAMRKDKVNLNAVLNNSSELVRMRTGSWRNATSGVQDAMDGFFSTQDKNILPWGHGNRYYNRGFNDRIKAFGRESELKQAYADLGFGLTNQAAVKRQFRDYETASELWANVCSALTCGGEELAAFEEYMPETVEAARQIIGGL